MYVGLTCVISNPIFINDEAYCEDRRVSEIFSINILLRRSILIEVMAGFEGPKIGDAEAKGFIWVFSFFL